MLERDYQLHVTNRLRSLFPGCLILKNDSDYLQGIPDWLILYKTMWGMLEVKRKRPTSSRDFEPNQEWYLAELNRMSFAACIYPENEQEVLDDLQHAFQPRRSARVSKRQ